MSAAQRAAANTSMDAALATITAAIPTWVSQGGSPSQMTRAILAALAASNPGFGRYIERRFGSSNLAGVKTTITAADTAP